MQTIDHTGKSSPLCMISKGIDMPRDGGLGALLKSQLLAPISQLCEQKSTIFADSSPVARLRQCALNDLDFLLDLRR